MPDCECGYTFGSAKELDRHVAYMLEFRGSVDHGHNNNEGDNDG